jgi:hypothetical protein
VGLVAAMNELQVAAGDLLKYIAARYGVFADVADNQLRAELEEIVAVREETAPNVPLKRQLLAGQLLATLAPYYPSPDCPSLQQLALRACEAADVQVPSFLAPARGPREWSPGREVALFAAYDKRAKFVKWLAECHETGIEQWAHDHFPSFPLQWHREKNDVKSLLAGRTGALAVIAVFAPSFLELFFDLLERKGDLAAALVLRCVATFDLGEGVGEDWIIDREWVLAQFLEHVIEGEWQKSVVVQLCCSVRYGDARALQLLCALSVLLARPYDVVPLYTCCIVDQVAPLLSLEVKGVSAEEQEMQCLKLSLLVEWFPDAARKYREEKSERTLLHVCAMQGDAARARVLVNAGVDPNAVDENGKRASELIVLNPDESQHWALMELMPESEEEKKELLRRVPVSGSFFAGALLSFCGYCLVLVAGGLLPLFLTFFLCTAFWLFGFWWGTKALTTDAMIDRRALKHIRPFVNWSHCTDLLGRPLASAVVFSSLVLVGVFLETPQAARMFLSVDVVCVVSAIRALVQTSVFYRAPLLLLILSLLLFISCFFYWAAMNPLLTFPVGRLVTLVVVKLFLFRTFFTLASGHSSLGVFEAVLRHWTRSAVAVAATMASVAYWQSCLFAVFCSAVAQMFVCVVAIWQFGIGGSALEVGPGEAGPISFAASSFFVVAVVHCWLVAFWGNVHVFIEGDAPVLLSCFLLLLLFWLLVRYLPAPLAVSKAREDA